MARAWLSLGGNLGDVRSTLARAVAALCDSQIVHLVARSADYRTPPWGIEDQPAFVNLCIAVESDLTPHALLARAQDIEQAFGRDRMNERRWGPRPIDIDLIAYDDVVIMTRRSRCRIPGCSSAPSSLSHWWRSPPTR